jgi:hypothetical protein
MVILPNEPGETPMPVKTTLTGATIVTGDSVALYRNLVVQKAMEFNIKTGLSLTKSNPFNVARKVFGLKGSKRKLYAGYCAAVGLNPQPL